MPPLDLSSDLPAPRDDEPSSLREEIFDELFDHLECSLQRERVKTADEDLARRRVIDKFGNPASIARKLWWDAMWEKIIMQRVTTFAAIVVAVAALGMCLFLWSEVRASREMQTAQLAEMREFFAEMRADARAPSPPAPQVDNGTVDVQVKLIGEDGTPAAGKVVLYSPPDNQPQPRVGGGRSSSPPPNGVRVGEQESATGEFKFANVPYGKYRIVVTATAAGAETRRDIFVRPGESGMTIVCPPALPPPSKLSVEFSPPEDLREVPLAYAVHLFGPTRASVREGNLSWQLVEPFDRTLVLDANGQQLGFLPSHEMDPNEALSANRGFSPLDMIAAESMEFRADKITAHLYVYGKTFGPAQGGSVRRPYFHSSGPNDDIYSQLIGSSGEQNFTILHSISVDRTTETVTLTLNPPPESWETLRTILQNPRLANSSNLVIEDGHFVDVSARQRLQQRIGSRGVSGGRRGGNASGARSGRGGARAPSNLFSELRRADTRKFVGLTSDQSPQVDAILEGYLARGLGRGALTEQQQALLQAAQSVDERNAVFSRLNEERTLARQTVEAQARELLTREQDGKLVRVWLQRNGPYRLSTDDAMAKEFDITDAQRDDIRRLYEERLQAGVTSTDLDALVKQYDEKMLDVLTPDQRAKWDELAGPPLVFGENGITEAPPAVNVNESE